MRKIAKYVVLRCRFSCGDLEEGYSTQDMHTTFERLFLLDALHDMVDKSFQQLYSDSLNSLVSTERTIRVRLQCALLSEKSHSSTADGAVTLVVHCILGFTCHVGGTPDAWKNTCS